MKVYLNRKQLLELSHPMIQLKLSNTQLFFLERQLKKASGDQYKLHSLKLKKGKIILEITLIGAALKLENSLKKTLNYLLVFQQENFKQSVSAQIKIRKVNNPFLYNTPIDLHPFT